MDNTVNNSYIFFFLINIFTQSENGGNSFKVPKDDKIEDMVVDDVEEKTEEKAQNIFTYKIQGKVQSKVEDKF